MLSPNNDETYDEFEGAQNFRSIQSNELLSYWLAWFWNRYFNGE